MYTIALSDGCTINYRFDGEAGKPVLLLSNALSSTMEMWDLQIPELSEHFRVLRYDGRGHGNSKFTPGPYTIERLGLDAKELIERLETGPVKFCGLSLGGMVGMWLAANAPDLVTRAVFSNTTAYFGQPDVWNERMALVEAEGMRAAADATIQRWLTQEFRSEHPDVTAKFFDVVANNRADGYLATAPAVRDVDLRSSLAAIDLPVLVIAGALDPATPPGMSELIAEEIADARLAILDAAHLANVEKIEEFNRLVISFLSHE